MSMELPVTVHRGHEPFLDFNMRVYSLERIVYIASAWGSNEVRGRRHEHHDSKPKRLLRNTG
jgi:hypothetical protein